jgi:hypothetical protein
MMKLKHTHAKKHHESKTHIQACTEAWQKYNTHNKSSMLQVYSITKILSGERRDSNRCIIEIVFLREARGNCKFL